MFEFFGNGCDYWDIGVVIKLFGWVIVKVGFCEFVCEEYLFNFFDEVVGELCVGWNFILGGVLNVIICC